MKTTDFKNRNLKAIYKKASEYISEINQVKFDVVMLAAYLMKESNTAEDDFYHFEEASKFFKDEDLKVKFEEILKENKKLNFFTQFLFELDKETIRQCILEYNVTTQKSEPTPNEILRLADKILNIKPKDSVLDMCTGKANALVHFYNNEPNARYSGWDNSSFYSTIAKCRATVLGKNVQITKQDALQKTGCSFDKIFIEPPFGNVLSKEKRDTIVQNSNCNISTFFYSTSEPLLFFLPLCNLLKEKGKAVVILPTNASFALNCRSVREGLVLSSRIEAVIEFPTGMYNNSATAVSMYVISENNQKIRFINFDDNATVDEVYSLYKSNERTNNAVTIKYKEGLKNDFSLCPNDYLQEKISFNCETIPLKNISYQIMKRQTLTSKQIESFLSEKPTDTVFINTSNIQNGYLNEDGLTYINDPDNQLEAIDISNKKVLIISKMWQPMKSAILENFSKKIVLGGNLYAFEIDEAMCDPYFVQAFIEYQEGRFIKPLLKGSALQTISLTDLQNLQIPIHIEPCSIDLSSTLKRRIEASKEAEKLIKQADEDWKNCTYLMHIIK